MKKMKVFEPDTTKIIDCKNGKVDWFQSTEEFRNRVQAWTDCKSKLADIRAQIIDEITRLEKSLAHYNDPALVIINEEIVAERRRNLPIEIQVQKDALAKVQEEIRAKVPAMSEMDERLYDAYKNNFEGNYTQAQAHYYKRAFMEWMDEAGVTPAEKTISYLMKQFGARAINGKALIKNGGVQFNRALTPTAFFGLLYGGIATDMMKVGALKPYTFSYKLPEKKKAASTTTAA